MRDLQNILAGDKEHGKSLLISDDYKQCAENSFLVLSGNSERDYSFMRMSSSSVCMSFVRLDHHAR